MLAGILKPIMAASVRSEIKVRGCTLDRAGSQPGCADHGRSHVDAPMIALSCDDHGRIQIMIVAKLP
jgi:hypothetical protein